jgi:hypothetical protein
MMKNPDFTKISYDEIKSSANFEQWQNMIEKETGKI